MLAALHQPSCTQTQAINLTIFTIFLVYAHSDNPTGQVQGISYSSHHIHTMLYCSNIQYLAFKLQERTHSLGPGGPLTKFKRQMSLTTKGCITPSGMEEQLR